MKLQRKSRAGVVIHVVGAGIALGAGACRQASPHSRVLMHETTSSVIQESEFPYVYKLSQGQTCTGTALSAHVLLTAAHCVPGDSVTVVTPQPPAGSAASLLDAAGIPSTYVAKLQNFDEPAASSSELNPNIGLAPGTVGVDIARSEFYGVNGSQVGARDLALAYFQQAVFPTWADVDWTFAGESGASLVAIGYGVRDDLGTTDGEKRIGAVGGDLRFDYGVIRSMVPFAGFQSAVLGPGDSGGPLFLHDTADQYHLVGVAHAGVVWRGTTKIYGTVSALHQAEDPLPPEEELRRETVWVKVNEPEIRQFIESHLAEWEATPPSSGMTEGPLEPPLSTAESGGEGVVSANEAAEHRIDTPR